MEEQPAMSLVTAALGAQQKVHLSNEGHCGNVLMANSISAGNDISPSF